jgi:phosphatidylserine/phosphatidylglycerophosphate/cardiolipin synthase-like enzyme
MAIQGFARAIANNDIVHIAWTFERPIPGCDGFAVYRQPAAGVSPWEPLRSLVEFENTPTAEAARPTTVTPVAGFHWRDFLDKTSRDTAVRYKVVAVRKTDGGVQPVPDVAEAVTGAVTPTELLADDIAVYFNRGILATQALATLLESYGGANTDALQAALADPHGQARFRLAGELQGALLQLLRERQQSGGRCYASLYELTDATLIAELLAAQESLHLVLSNNTGDRTKGYDYANGDARRQLGQSRVALTSRYLPDSRSIGHNKFLVLTDGHDTAQAVLTGSTNWTRSGLCTQSNNAIILRSPALASAYLEDWRALKRDTDAAGIPAKAAPVAALQGAALRAADRQPSAEVTLADGTTKARVWFSPNTPTLLPNPGKPPKRPPTPPDMQALFDAVDAATQAVLVLAFQPGAANTDASWTLPKQLAVVCRSKPWLFVRGAISDSEEAMEFEALRTPEMDAEIVAPAGILKDDEQWQREIVKAGHAIVHNKIVVIDPFSDDCLVVTGSHNLGFKASYNNDENMLFVRGNRKVAEAYAAHVADVFEHYRWRWYEQRAAQRRAAAEWVRAGSRKATALKVDPKAFYDINFNPSAPAANWQDRYFDQARLAAREREFWAGQGQALGALVPDPSRTRAFGYTPDERKLAAARKAAKAAQKAAKAAATGTTAPKKQQTAAASKTKTAAPKRKPVTTGRKPGSRKKPAGAAKKSAARRTKG